MLLSPESTFQLPEILLIAVRINLKTGVFTSEQITYSMPTEPLSCDMCSWTSISASLLLLMSPPPKAHTQVRRRWGKAVSVYEYLKEFLIIEREGEAFFLNIKFKK